MRASNNLGDGLDEPIHLEDWNSGWLNLASMLGAELAGLLGREGQIEHVGSTAVEGMRAKPVLDLMLGAADEAEQEAFAQKLAEAGWQDMGEAGVPGRRHLRRRSGQHANVHIVFLGSPLWVNNLAIRDFLRAHPDERAAYVALKQSIVASGADQLLAYSDRKAPFMTALLLRATAWRTMEGMER